MILDVGDMYASRRRAGVTTLSSFCVGHAGTQLVPSTSSFGTDVTIPKCDAARTLQHSRGHWGAENRLHRRLEVVFGEDQRRIRNGHAAESFWRVRRIAWILLKA